MTVKPITIYACPQCGYKRTLLRSELNDLYPSKKFVCHLCDCTYELVLSLFVNVINLTLLESNR